jgi:hypothetical protein
MTRHDAIRLAKAGLWEEAKGKLRALAAVNGQVHEGDGFSPDWEEVRNAVEDFIRQFEEDGLHE